jgi:hypothetical protein
MNIDIDRKKWKFKGKITIQKLVLIVIGISVMAITMLTIKNSIDGAYAQGLETALEN